MTTTSEEDIRSAVRSAGIPLQVLATTLPKEGETKLREYVLSRRYVKKGSYSGVYVYPSKSMLSMKARRAFFLLAKELLMFRVSVYCTSLLDLSRHLLAEYDEDSGIDGADILFVSDFYEQGATMPLDARSSAIVRSWMRGRMEKGKGISLLSDASPTLIDSWWPASFRAVIETSLEVFRIEA